ncbi:MAG: HypC/HybG/HupF family hydrogenase formation chaperone [Candidatus Sumerlaeia bacterium]|nr:HypC/HybG/HupF family hydrogenase formation chaperone [Candidatus Sumerlaeia bacterium]
MCLAIPAKLVDVHGDEGVIEIGGSRKTVMLTLVANAQPGQYVLLHAGYAIEIIDEAEAQELAALHRSVLDSEGDKP